MSNNQEVPQSLPVIKVDKDAARKFLDTRYENERPVRLSKVRAFARDMANDEWHFIGDPIRFDASTGNLTDGQHRLLAVELSNTVQYFPVIDLPETARAHIDTGTARSLGDVLHYGNHMAGRELAAIVRRLLLYRNGAQGTGGGTYKPTHAEGLAFVNAHKDEVEQATRVGLKLHNHPLPVAPSAVGAAYFLCAERNRDQAEDFFHSVITGTGLHVGDPALAFRAKALRWSKKEGGNLPPNDVFRFLIQAWNAYRDGARITKLQQPRGGWNATNVPVPK